MVLSQGVFPRAVQSSNIGDKSRLLIAEAKTTPDLSPASAGVKLLRQIFLQLRNPQNQLALNYSNSNRQLLAASQSVQSVLNQSLLIRPTEKSSNMNQALDGRSSAKALRRDTAVSAYTSAPKVAMSAPAPAGYGGKVGGIYTQTATNATNALAKDASSGFADDASADYKAAAPASAALRARAHKKSAAPAANPELSPGNQQMLAQTMSRVMQGTRQMGSQLTQATTEASVHNFGAAKTSMQAERTISTQPGGPLIQQRQTCHRRKRSRPTRVVERSGSRV